MTKIISIIVSIIMAFMNLIIPAEKPFECETVKIKGVTYQNGFVPDNMHLMKEYNLHKETPIHLELLFDPISIGWFYFDDYYQFEENFVWKNAYTDYGQDVKENLFCPVEKWDYYHSFYGDSDNYKFYFNLRMGAPYEIGAVYNEFFDIQSADSEMVDKLIQFFVDNKYGSSTKNRAETLSLPDILCPEIWFYKESKDGLFYAKAMRYIIYNGNIYCYRYSNGSNGTIEVAILPDELEDYIISLLKDAGLENYLEINSQAG